MRRLLSRVFLWLFGSKPVLVIPPPPPVRRPFVVPSCGPAREFDFEAWCDYLEEKHDLPSRYGGDDDWPIGGAGGI